MAGCTQGVPHTTSDPSPPSSKPSPVHITDSGDLTNGATKTYVWLVDPNYTRLAVKFEMAGAAGSPDYLRAAGQSFRLTDGVDHDVRNETRFGWEVRKNGCYLCYESVPGTARHGPAPGVWVFSFTVDHATATYALDITVDQ